MKVPWFAIPQRFRRYCDIAVHQNPKKKLFMSRSSLVRDGMCAGPITKLCWDPWGTRYFNTGCACFPWFLSFGNRTQNSRVSGARPNHQPIGGSVPNHQGIWIPPRAGLAFSHAYLFWCASCHQNSLSFSVKLTNEQLYHAGYHVMLVSAWKRVVCQWDSSEKGRCDSREQEHVDSLRLYIAKYLGGDYVEDLGWVVHWKHRVNLDQVFLFWCLCWLCVCD